MALLMSLSCKSWDLIVMGGLEQTSLANTIFLSITKVKTHWKAILTHYLKKWMQKDKDKWLLDRLLTNTLLDETIYITPRCAMHPYVSCTPMAIIVKWCPSWNLLYLQILIMALSFITTLIGRLMALKATVSHVMSVTTTSTMKT